MKSVPLSEAKDRLDELLQRAASGEEIVIADSKFRRVRLQFAGPVTRSIEEAVLDPVLDVARALLRKVYGARIERIVLFGSRSRGDARSDSDYDIALFLRDMADRSNEIDRLAEIQTELIDQTGAFIHIMPFVAGALSQRTPLMHEIRSEGVEI